MSPSHPHGCPSYRRLNRRQALQVGVLGGLGVSLANTYQQEAAAAVANSATAGKAKSVILLWLQGGVSHHETFDPKPDATADVRGELTPIKTNLPGVTVGELMPKLATMMDKLAVVRSVTHTEAAHQRGSIYMVEARQPPRSTGVEASGNPQLGAIVSHELGMRSGVPPFVSIPGNDFTSKFVGAGFLPKSADAFAGTNANSLSVPEGFSADRFRNRLQLQGALENINQRRTIGRLSASWDEFNQRAVDVIASDRAGRAFHWEAESAEIQKLYGIIDESGKQNSGQIGQLALTARRLVEAGVRYVTIGRNSWDHHSNMFPQLKSRVPRFDHAYAGLLTDLESKGLLDETLVVYLTEFGRTPKVNAQAGRDHWPGVFSVSFSGAGIKTGQVLGSSDAVGGEVADFPVTPEEIGATILQLAGVNPHGVFVGNDGRPKMYIDHAEPISALLG